jgi:hypothetical protein
MMSEHQQNITVGKDERGKLFLPVALPSFRVADLSRRGPRAPTLAPVAAGPPECYATPSNNTKPNTRGARSLRRLRCGVTPSSVA